MIPDWLLGSVGPPTFSAGGRDLIGWQRWALAGLGRFQKGKSRVVIPEADQVTPLVRYLLLRSSTSATTL